METELTNELDRIKEFEKEEAIRGIHPVGYFYLLLSDLAFKTKKYEENLFERFIYIHIFFKLNLKKL